MKDFNAMSKEELVELLTDIAESVQYAEDGGDFCLYVMKKLEVEQADLGYE